MKTILAILSAIIFLVLACPQVWGQSADSNAPVSLTDYLRLAAANSAELKAEFEKWRAAIEQIPQAKSLSDPQLTYGYATEPTPQRSMLEVMQMFPWFGVIEARTDTASAMAKSAGRQYEAKKLAVFYEVKQAFYEYNFLARAIEITNENLRLMRHFEEVARTKYAISMTGQPDVIRAQVELATMENDLVSWEKSRPAITAKLNSLLNRAAESELPWPKSPPYKEMPIDYKQVQELITRNNPELQSAAYDIEAARNNEKLAKKKFYPEFGVGVAVDAGMGNDMHSRTMPKIQLTLPIWRDNYKAAERQAHSQLIQTIQQKVQTENTLASRAQQVLYELQDSDRKIRLYRDTITPKVKEMITASETAYEAGSLDFLNLIDSQRTLIRYQLEYERTIADNGQRLAELEMLIGTQISNVDSAGK
jgi:outer membrane protein TolC